MLPPVFPYLSSLCCIVPYFQFALEMGQLQGYLRWGYSVQLLPCERRVLWALSIATSGTSMLYYMYNRAYSWHFYSLAFLPLALRRPRTLCRVELVGRVHMLCVTVDVLFIRTYGTAKLLSLLRNRKARNSSSHSSSLIYIHLRPFPLFSIYSFCF